jgi:hypothetical protein
MVAPAKSLPASSEVASTTPEVVSPPRASVGVDPRPDINRRLVHRIFLNHDARSGHHDRPANNYGLLD